MTTLHVFTARVVWECASAEGTATLIGPDVWDEYDRVMATERRTAVFIAPSRIYSNG
ncbi:MAG: hypothetical protein HY828_21355 [Actinobacteria bacterium]|nr:hypothetical protein [Actinomycetota bacterium]